MKMCQLFRKDYKSVVFIFSSFSIKTGFIELLIKKHNNGLKLKLLKRITISQKNKLHISSGSLQVGR